MSTARTRKSFDIETSRAIGSRIRAARGPRSQAEFAEAIGVSRATLTNYEAGRRLPNDLVLKAISELSGVSVHQLLFGNTLVPFDEYISRAEAAAIALAAKRPGFIPRFMISDDEIAFVSLFRLMREEKVGWDIIAKVVGYWEDELVSSSNLPHEPAIQWGEGHLERLKSALTRGTFEQGYDPLQSYWVTLWGERHERTRMRRDQEGQ